MAAKGKYSEWQTEEGLTKLEGWARDGLVDAQIAANIGINVKTLYDWKNKHSNICKALKKGKEVVDRQVENALLKRAIGYEYDEVSDTEEETEEGCRTIHKITKKQVVPDVTAQIFWLKNRKPHEWRDKQELEVKGTVGFADILKKARERVKNGSDKE